MDNELKPFRALNIWNEINQGRQAETADNHLARFIGRRYLPLRKEVNVLDIGPGRHGANQTYLESKGFNVVSIDLSYRSRSNIRGDVREYEFQLEQFDLIIDINTLCHVEGMDYGKLRSWLKPQGRFFSLMPAAGTWQGQWENKGFVWCPTEPQVAALFEDWSGVRFGPASYPDSDGNSFVSWVIEAIK